LGIGQTGHATVAAMAYALTDTGCIGVPVGVADSSVLVRTNQSADFVVTATDRPNSVGFLDFREFAGVVADQPADFAATRDGPGGVGVADKGGVGTRSILPNQSTDIAATRDCTGGVGFTDDG